ncbi:MAG: TauD/TfdA family dioxygenase [Pseudomonadota bacterium]
MQITSISGSFAQRVDGLSLWETISASDIESLRRALSDFGVLHVPRQALSGDELADFSARFGELDVIVRTDWQLPERREVVLISNLRTGDGASIGGLGSGELSWHTDQSYMTSPATGSGLYLVEPPRTPTRTQWCNLKLAYRALDDAIKRRLAGKRAVFDYLKRQSTYDDEPKMSAELRRKTPLVTHPLVNEHPVSGEKALYFDPTTTTTIVGLDEAEGTALLDELTEHVTQEEFIYTHQWMTGDVVIWDNGFMLHRRDDFPIDEHRVLLRTTFRLPPDRHIVPAGALFDS